MSRSLFSTDFHLLSDVKSSKIEVIKDIFQNLAIIKKNLFQKVLLKIRKFLIMKILLTIQQNIFSYKIL